MLKYSKCIVQPEIYRFTLLKKFRKDEIIYENESYCVIHFDSQEEFLTYRETQ